MSTPNHEQPHIPEKFKPLTVVKRGNHTSHLPKKFAEVNAALARQAGEGK